MTNIEPATIGSRLQTILADSGLPVVVGGKDAFDSGMEDLKSGLLKVAAELVDARRHNVELADVTCLPKIGPLGARNLTLST